MIETSLIVIAGVFFAILTTVGNLMVSEMRRFPNRRIEYTTISLQVLISFKIDRQLQTISNYFLFSLAVADVMIGESIHRTINMQNIEISRFHLDSSDDLLSFAGEVSCFRSLSPTLTPFPRLFYIFVPLRRVGEHFKKDLRKRQTKKSKISSDNVQMFFRWDIGYIACQFWLCLDYLMSNASVLNLLLISFDRFFSVTRPLSYRPRYSIYFMYLMTSILYQA